jgi:hypothetical protein
LGKFILGLQTLQYPKRYIFLYLQLESTIIEKGYTRTGGATELFQGCDGGVTRLAPRRVDGAARLCLAELGTDQVLCGGRGHQAVAFSHPLVIGGLQHAERGKKWAETRSRPPENIRHSTFSSRSRFALLFPPPLQGRM